MHKARGTIKFWTDKGYGFIKPDDGGRDLFCHISALPKGTPKPANNAGVEYDVEQNSKGVRAVNVSLL